MKNHQLITELNNLLNSESFSEDALKELLSQSAEAGLKVELIDLTIYNEEKLLYAEKEKHISIKSQMYDRAVLMRDTERTCLKAIELKEKHNVNNSLFCIDDDCLIFIYTGTGINDEKLKELVSGHKNP